MRRNTPDFFEERGYVLLVLLVLTNQSEFEVGEVSQNLDDEKGGRQVTFEDILMNLFSSSKSDDLSEKKRLFR